MDDQNPRPATARPSATIVLATHARPDFLGDCVESIAAAMGPHDELLVMVCCNPDASQVLSGLAVPATLVAEPHAGKSTKLNAGIRRANTEVILITDDDCRVPPDWVDAMVAPFANGLLGVAFGPSVGLSSAPGGSGPPVIAPGPVPPELWNFAHGLSMSVRRSAASDVGGFDERLGAGMSAHGGEEGDLVLRLAARGWTCEVAAGAPVCHLEWRTFEETMRNILGYQRGAGIYLGAGLRRDPRLTFKPFLLRLAHEVGYWRARRTRGWRFGPTMTLQFAVGLARGIALPSRKYLEATAMTRPAREEVRVLWVTDEPPDRHQGGGNIRQAMLLDSLHGHLDITVLLAGRLVDESTRRHVSTVLEVPVPRLRSSNGTAQRRLRDVWRVLVQRQPSETVTSVRVRRVLRPVLDRIADEFDVVVIQHLALAPLLPKRRCAAWVLHLFDVASVRTRHELVGESGRRQQWLLRREAVNAERYERTAVRSYDRVVVVSEPDAIALGLDSNSVVPNGVDTSRPAPTPLTRKPRMLLPATLDYRPNVLGALWFCKAVLPLVQAQVPDVRFAIVGRRPVEEVISLARQPGVEVHADVPRMASWLAWARVVVVPLQIGTGTRLKALEAMAAGRPVVGTTIGLEGLDVSDGVQARVTDEPVAMAGALVELLTSDATADALAAAGRLHVEAHFGWDTIAGTLAAALKAAAVRGRLS